MEQLFNPQSSGNGRREIQLCIFPHLQEFLVIDSRQNDPDVLFVKTDEIFGEDFYRAVEAEFSEALRCSSKFPFSHLINLPIAIEEAVRDIAMTFILERLGVPVEQEEAIPTVVVYVVSGGALATHTGKVLESLQDLARGDSPGADGDSWEVRISDLVERETAILQEINDQQVAEALKGDSPDYFTLWESRN
ncbi:MAG: hypothetical protein CL759_04705 [Chloroflexi bacterium]|nr:hypothetical protein [Chloroflexota bacterium]